MYVKLFSSILDSSVWSTDATTRIVWVTMLAMADEDGFVRASVTGLARRANVTLEDCERALVTLTGPDPESASPEDDGRRAMAMPGGWQLTNYKKYRELRDKDVRRAQNRERVRRYRERHHVTQPVMQSNAGSHQAEAEAEAEAALPMTTSLGEQPPATDPTTKRWNTVLAPIIRDVWWSDGQPHQPDPDGKPWTMDRDMSLLKVAVARGRKVADLEPAIRGLRLLRKTGAVDARLLTDGNVWRMAIAAYYDADNKPRKPKANPMQKYLGAP